MYFPEMEDMLMAATPTNSSGKQNQSSDDHLWSEIYETLTVYVRVHIRNAGVQSWRGQEYDLVEDIVQETVVRAYLYLRKVESGEARAVLSLQSFTKTIARNHSEDRRRKETRTLRPSDDSKNGEVEEAEDERFDPIEDALEDLAYISLMVEIVRLIATFPDKQRIALLTDLANIACRSEYPTFIEEVFLDAGIYLREYQCPLPEDKKLRSRHASLLSYVYKRLNREAYPILREQGFVV